MTVAALGDRLAGHLAGDDESKAAREADRDQPGDDGTDREGGQRDAGARFVGVEVRVSLDFLER